MPPMTRSAVRDGGLHGRVAGQEEVEALLVDDPTECQHVGHGPERVRQVDPAQGPPAPAERDPVGDHRAPTGRQSEAGNGVVEGELPSNP